MEVRPANKLVQVADISRLVLRIREQKYQTPMKSAVTAQAT